MARKVQKRTNTQLIAVALMAFAAIGSVFVLNRDAVFSLNRAAGTGIPACPKSTNAAAGVYVVNFNGGLIRSDQTEAAALLHSNAASPRVPKGTYKVTLVSYDKDHTSTNTQVQGQESWYGELRTGAAGATGRVFARTANSSDLPDKELIGSYTVNSSITLSEEVWGVTAKHAAYKNSNANSVNPVCAIFEPAGGVVTGGQCNYVEFKVQ